MLFSIIVGNPPYITSSNMVKKTPNIRLFCQEKYKVAQGNWDAYIIFLFLSYVYINHSGVFCLITPIKWFTAPYGFSLREFLIKHIIILLDLSEYKVFDAGVSASISVVKKIESDHCLCSRYLGNVKVCKKSLAIRSDNISILFSEYLDILNYLNRYMPLSYYATVVSSGSTSDAYKVASCVRLLDNLESNTFRVITTGVIRKFFNLFDTKPQTINKSLYLRPVLIRDDLFRINERRYNIANQAKILVSGKRYLDAFLDIDGKFASYHTVPIILYKCISLKALVTIINSSIAFFFINEYFNSLSIDGGISFNWEILSKIPIPDLSKEDVISLESIADKFMSTCSFLREDLVELDNVVCDIYFNNCDLSGVYKRKIIEYGQKHFRRKEYYGKENK